MTITFLIPYNILTFLQTSCVSLQIANLEQIKFQVSAFALYFLNILEKDVKCKNGYFTLTSIDDNNCQLYYSCSEQLDDRVIDEIKLKYGARIRRSN